ncbi:hypothetical protein M406DRAFT_357254 [Cryphonectria parasitica EP155]|uniref:Clr5 domain-containing protein n=1 Tax=Cryphonectria parasitica (strain ATCC 38755 / EP155) TaxID=660469 RepID=A0A9P4Y0F2_CRYP1|nr:uncharacterized protein M406DRAFT_357254 [Cryphonectria parasitica EP155]KAF3763860.1 hypothetical protein M406DRAFT_357254 [Cryphonectria parasitica EP155]
MDNTQPPPATTITATPTPIRLPPHQRHDQQHQQQHSLHGDGDASTNISTTATITTSSAADLSSSELTLAKFVPMETPPQPPPAASSEATRLRPAPGSQEWEAHKSMINDLYMGRNLNLNEVVEQMRLSCDFIATPRMYKAQFAKWGWSKYNCKRMRRDVSSGKPVVRSQGKSCYRVKKHRGAVTTAAEKERQDSQDSGTSARVGPSGSSSAQQTQDSGAVVEVGPRGTSSSSTATTMGRSGYDKTNMRDAQNPRVAGTKKETKAAADLLTAQPHPVLGPKQTQSAKTTSASSQEQAMSAAPMAQSKAQERSDLPFTIHVPFECEGGQCVDAEDEIPVPSLVGRGWTFWS